MEKLEPYKIITLEDNDGKEKEYTIASMTEYNEGTYLYLIEVDENENIIEQSQMIAKLVIKGDEQAIEKVTEAEELKEVSRIFFELFKENLDENN